MEKGSGVTGVKKKLGLQLKIVSNIPKLIANFKNIWVLSSMTIANWNSASSFELFDLIWLIDMLDSATESVFVWKVSFNREGALVHEQFRAKEAIKQSSKWAGIT